MQTSFCSLSLYLSLFRHWCRVVLLTALKQTLTITLLNKKIMCLSKMVLGSLKTTTNTFIVKNNRHNNDGYNNFCNCFSRIEFARKLVRPQTPPALLHSWICYMSIKQQRRLSKATVHTHIHTHTQTLTYTNTHTVLFSSFFLSALFLSLPLSLCLSYTHSLKIIEKQQEKYIWISRRTKNHLWIEQNLCKKTYFEPCLIF